MYCHTNPTIAYYKKYVDNLYVLRNCQFIIYMFNVYTKELSVYYQIELQRQYIGKFGYCQCFYVPSSCTYCEHLKPWNRQHFLAIP